MKSINALIMTLFVGLFASVATARIEGTNASYAARGIQTQGIYYRDSSFDQVLIGAKVELNFTSAMPFWRIGIQLSEDTDPSMLSNFKLYKTSVNYFAPARATELTGGTLSVNGRDIFFDLWNSGSGPHPNVMNGDHIWVTARVANNADPGVEVDAKITAVHINGFVCGVENEDPVGAGMTYEFRRHVVPYYRMARVGNWNDAYYDVISEVIFFYMGVSGNGSMYYGWEMGQYDETSFRNALERLRDGRGDRPVRILLGLAHCAEGLSQATQNAESRARLVDQIIHYVELFGFDGVDIDWEYPWSAADWRGFEKLVAELKPRLFALGGGKMVSSAMSNYKLPEAVNTYGLSEVELKGLHQQLDFFNTMTYDNGTMDGHSPMWMHNNSKNICAENAGLPPVKSCIGVPFYVNEHDPNLSEWNNLTWLQMGYDWIYYTFPQYMDSTDTFWHNGYMYSYNSIKTIREKGADLRAGGYGVMIWGYECDISYDNPKSLARALASTIRPLDSVDNPEVKDALDWAHMSTGDYILTADLTLTADDFRPLSFTGTIDGQGHTITLKGGGAAISGGMSGVIKNLTVVVEGALSATGAVTDTVTLNGCVENVTVIVKEGASITGVNSVGAVVGEVYANNAERTASVKHCTAVIEGTLRATGNGRVGGVVGNLNQEGESEVVRILNCRAELCPTAVLHAPDTNFPGVGGLVGNCNKGYELFAKNSVVLYKGATLSAATRVGALAGGSTYGTMSGYLNNWVIMETSDTQYATNYTSQVLDFTIGEPDRKTKTAMVEYRDRETGVSFRIRREVIFSASGFSFRLR